MSLVLGRAAVLEEYARAAEKGWVLPAFNTENQTCLEAILAAAKAHADTLGEPYLPIIVGVTNLYWHRSQTVEYTRTGSWKVGLRLFLDDVAVLCGEESPYADLRVMIHMDHIQWDADEELLTSDLGRFSSIMYDASTRPFEENIRSTAEFVKEHGDTLLIEGACDEIPEASEDETVQLTTPDMAERYMRETGVDIIVANLGTEHRASAKDLHYHGELAREIKGRIGTHICLHGTSSVSADQVRNLFDDGICKVNVWTALERDSSPTLLEDMLRHADEVVGPAKADALAEAGLLGPQAPRTAQAAVSYFTTSYRQTIVFEQMKRVVGEFLELWYT
ncbi:MAG: class II fructose-bisphosphate aldolase [Lentisphaerae bacterium]|nr:class II fructose-bisphosphate aldolase [Lentisphaerota bacterium]